MEYKHPIYGNTGLREMTQEEIEFYSNQSIPELPEKSPEERITELEEELKATKILLGMEVV